MYIADIYIYIYLHIVYLLYIYMHIQIQDIYRVYVDVYLNCFSWPSEISSTKKVI